MPLFRAYFKIIRGSALMLAVILAVFTIQVVLFSSGAPEGGIAADFETARVPIAVINRDGDAPLTRGLAAYLARNSDVVPLPDNEEKLQDALFYREVHYIAIIPPGFSEGFMAGRDCAVQKITVPGSAGSFYVDLALDRFLNTARLHRSYGKEESQAALVQSTLRDLAFDTPVAVRSAAGTDGYHQGAADYFAYCAFGLLAMIMTGISQIMLTFNGRDLYLRNLGAPLPRRSMNLQLAAGHGVFALACWAILLLGGFILHGRSLLAAGSGGLYALNTLVFTAVCAAIGFLVGGFVKNQGVQAGAINIVALGLSFLGGVFVPQSVMSKSVLAVARYLPSYWFMRANETIGLAGFSGGALQSVYSSILIQLGFALAIFSVALFLGKERRKAF